MVSAVSIIGYAQYMRALNRENMISVQLYQTTARLFGGLYMIIMLLVNVASVQWWEIFKICMARNFTLRCYACKALHCEEEETLYIMTCLDGK